MEKNKKRAIAYLCLNFIFLFPSFLFETEIKFLPEIFEPLILASAVSFLFYFGYNIFLIHIVVSLTVLIIDICLSDKCKKASNKLFYKIFIPLLTVNIFLNIYCFRAFRILAMSIK